MQTITIQANESFIKEIKELIQQKAKLLNEKVSFENEINQAVKEVKQTLKDIANNKAIFYDDNQMQESLKAKGYEW